VRWPELGEEPETRGAEADYADRHARLCKIVRGLASSALVSSTVTAVFAKCGAAAAG
jgi:hypothetical protein